MRSRALLLALLVGVAPIARAVIVAGPDGTINIGAPGDGAPWDHVGTIGGTTGVYLGAYGGGYWVITADHVGVGDFTVNNTTYTAVGGSGVQIAGADLLVFRLMTEPPLTSLALSATAPVASSSITMIGNGVNRDTSLTTWFVDTGTNPATWSTSFFGAANFATTGYLWGSGNTMRWGTNQITGTTTFNNTSLLYSTFDQVGDAQGATGDSGGGVFYLNGSTWELTGIMDYIGTFNGQPGSTAVFDNTTMFADISDYRSAILTAIPEPANVAAWCAGLAAAFAAWSRRRSRA
jgi:hypothetical protein